VGRLAIMSRPISLMSVWQVSVTGVMFRILAPEHGRGSLVGVLALGPRVVVKIHEVVEITVGHAERLIAVEVIDRHDLRDAQADSTHDRDPARRYHDSGQGRARGDGHGYFSFPLMAERSGTFWRSSASSTTSSSTMPTRSKPRFWQKCSMRVLSLSTCPTIVLVPRERQ